MANKVPEDALNELLDIVAAHPDGVAAPDIAKRLSDGVPRRTLQYRLNQLVSNGRLQMEGSGRWAKYRLAATDTSIAAEQNEQNANYSHLIALSDNAKAIRDYVQQLEQRACRNAIHHWRASRSDSRRVKNLLKMVNPPPAVLVHAARPCRVCPQPFEEERQHV